MGLRTAKLWSGNRANHMVLVSGVLAVTRLLDARNRPEYEADRGDPLPRPLPSER
jgi:hypothetical protein